MTEKMPDEIYAADGPSENYVRMWYKTKGMGTRYIRADLAPSGSSELQDVLLRRISFLEHQLRDSQAIGEHCKDCCCARCWKALGVTEYTGKSIPEHIEQLRAAVALSVTGEVSALTTPTLNSGMVPKNKEQHGTSSTILLTSGIVENVRARIKAGYFSKYDADLIETLIRASQSAQPAQVDDVALREARHFFETYWLKLKKRSDISKRHIETLLSRAKPRKVWKREELYKIANAGERMPIDTLIDAGVVEVEK